MSKPNKRNEQIAREKIERLYAVERAERELNKIIGGFVGKYSDDAIRYEREGTFRRWVNRIVRAAQLLGRELYCQEKTRRKR